MDQNECLLILDNITAKLKDTKESNQILLVFVLFSKLHIVEFCFRLFISNIAYLYISIIMRGYHFRKKRTCIGRCR